MNVIVNGRVWIIQLDSRIGSGGFGSVYLATSDGEEAVAKLVPKDPGAHRELILADDVGGVPNVMPVMGVADASDSWAVLMPRAQQSLRDLLVDVGGSLDEMLARPILLDIAHALVSLKRNGVVHRDLKPDNVLLFDEHWCLTDFGISRYAEATTATDTRKYSMTKAYAAPEQWRGERATSASDIYSFGITAYEILAGNRPFSGPNYRNQHLHEQPPSLVAAIDNPLRSIIDECLIKAAQARPTPERLLARLKAKVKADASTAGATAAIIKAHQAEVQRISDKACYESAAKTERARRSELFDAARQAFLQIEGELSSLIRAHAPSANQGEWPIRLGDARLELLAPTPSTPNRVPFDVIAHTEIAVCQVGRSGTDYIGRSHSLWYCDAHEEDHYRWFETAFMRHPLMADEESGRHASSPVMPFSVSPNSEEAQHALRSGVGTYQVAWPFEMLQDESMDEFVERWTIWFAEAATGNLERPRIMPERNASGSWRT